VELQPDLFGEPPRLPELSQLFTPLWLARRIAQRWVRREWHVLEPCVGRGNLVQGLLDAGHSPMRIFGVELDSRWVTFARKRFDERVPVIEADFRQWLPHRTFDCVTMNPPWEDNLHMEFVLRALELAPFVNIVVPATFDYSSRRDEELWKVRGVVNRRAILPERVKFSDGKSDFDMDCNVLQIGRRGNRRRVGEVRMVHEETWRPDDIPEAA
jgi:predicted RNA methylase